ncbi:MAG: HxsD-like protein [Clostridia bacterium]|nr:HxsD-like protein [Clostridia bacterium]
MIEFDTSLYAPEAVRKAIQDYSGLARITLEEEGGVCRCRFSRCRYPLRLTQLEFANYVLNLTVSMRGAAHDDL